MKLRLWRTLQAETDYDVTLTVHLQLAVVNYATNRIILNNSQSTNNSATSTNKTAI